MLPDRGRAVTLHIKICAGGVAFDELSEHIGVSRFKQQLAEDVGRMKACIEVSELFVVFHTGVDADQTQRRTVDESPLAFVVFAGEICALDASSVSASSVSNMKSSPSTCEISRSMPRVFTR